MLYAGLGWTASGYEVDIVDDSGARVTPTASFGRAQIPLVIEYIRAAGDAVVAVVESSNGIVDGQMMAAGLTVYRADPPVLPDRPVFGSVPAVTVARAAQRGVARLTRLERSRGTQTGREWELEACIASSAAAQAALASAGRCVSHGDRGRPEVALTFDDGPQPPYTGQVLDILERYAVPATFFSVGLHAGGFPGELVRMREQGHQLGNHTWSHPFLHELTAEQVSAQLDRAGEGIALASGGAPPAVLRPPYGSRTPRVLRWLAALEPTVVLWDVEAEDWAMPGAATISRRVLDQARPGSVVLLHDGGGDRSQTVAALPAIVEGLLAKGYRFVPVSAFTAAQAPSPNNNHTEWGVHVATSHSGRLGGDRDRRAGD